MVTYLIRHADAGKRADYDGPDFERPLSSLGHAQAAALARHLRHRGVTRLVSSRAVRCMQTFGPSSRTLDLEVEIDDALTEGSSPAAALALVTADLDGVTAMCSHGDIIPEVMRLLALRGVELDRAPSTCAKGSIWTIDLRDETTGSAAYLRRAPDD